MRRLGGIHPVPGLRKPLPLGGKRRKVFRFLELQEQQLDRFRIMTLPTPRASLEEVGSKRQMRVDCILHLVEIQQ